MVEEPAEQELDQDKNRKQDDNDNDRLQAAGPVESFRFPEIRPFALGAHERFAFYQVRDAQEQDGYGDEPSWSPDFLQL